MKKRVYGFLVGATMLMVVGVFTTFEVKAEPIEQNYDLGQGLPVELWCDLMGNDCIGDGVIITPEN